MRGYEIYKRLICGKLGTIPIGVDTDNPPGTPTDCKPVRYRMRKQVTCATRHLFQHLGGRPDTTADRFTLASLSVQYQESPQLKNILIAIIKSPAITYRMSE